MKTRCPNCQTVFRVTPEQLKARAGKVRCGTCQAAFNALDHLIENVDPPAPPATVLVADAVAPPPGAPPAAPTGVRPDAPSTASGAESNEAPAPDLLTSADDAAPNDPPDAPASAAAETPPASAQAVAGSAYPDGLLPRETSEIPGYSKWAEGLMAPLPTVAERPPRWPFVLAIVLLAGALAGQLTFRFRSELAVAMPVLRPLLVVLAEAFDTDIPAPRHVDLISIESSDLQTDAAHGNLLALSALLRNRAAYDQALPSLELTLTDNQDTVIARRVFPPAEYLAPKTAVGNLFPAGSDLPVRLWIEAKELAPSGYRLYVFYP